MESSKPTAYPYIRFSSEKQSQGDSLRRQEQLIRDWSYDKENKDIRVAEEKYKDLGISGYSGKHLDKEMGKLIAAIDTGYIKAGDYILLESIDRAGRLPTEDMLPILMKIVKQGITIVTLEDRQKYNKESIANSAIYVLVGKIQSAHNYSKQLSTRVAKAREAKRNAVLEGEAKKLSKACPWWLEWSDEGNDWFVIDDKVTLVKLIFEMYIQGQGYDSITRFLNKNHPGGIAKAGRNIKVKGWHSSAVKRLIQERKVLGEVIAKDEAIENYYPAVIDVSTYQKALDINKRRAASTNVDTDKPRPVFNAFRDMVYCCCGEKCNHENMGRGYFRYRCSNHKRGICRASDSFNVKVLDIHVRSFMYLTTKNALIHQMGAYDQDAQQEVNYTGLIRKKTEQVERCLEVYTEELYLDRDKALENLRQAKADLRDLEASKKANDLELLTRTQFNIADIVNTEIPGDKTNLFFKKRELRITLHNNGVCILSLSSTDLLKIKKPQCSIIGSVSTIINETSPMFVSVEPDGGRRMHIPEWHFENYGHGHDYVIDL